MTTKAHPNHPIAYDLYLLCVDRLLSRYAYSAGLRQYVDLNGFDHTSQENADVMVSLPSVYLSAICDYAWLMANRCLFMLGER